MGIVGYNLCLPAVWVCLNVVKSHTLQNMRRSVLVIPCSEPVNRFHKAQVREMVEEKKTEFYRLHSLLRAERILDCV